ncbi:MAG: 4-hydroxymandelate oxidase [Desulfovibrio sp.]
MAYQASMADMELDIINLDILEQEAAEIMEKGAYGYVQGGAGEEWTMRRNREALNEKNIVPRVLANLENPDTRTSVLGIDLPSPIIVSPSAAHGLCHVDGEKATARAAAEMGTIMSVSTYANYTIEEIAKAGGGAPWWFQIYMSKDDEFNEFLLDLAVKSGARAIILTADATVGGNREADKVNNFTFPLPMANLARFGDGKGQGIGEIYAKALQKIQPADVEKLAKRSKLPVIVKGIQAPEDALLSINAGASAVWVSNHGGRQLDGGPGSFDVLSSVADAVAGRVPVIFDSGIRHAQHVFKALASGADIVGVSRPLMYALCLGGSKAVASVFRYLNRELGMVMQLAGTRNIEEVKKTVLW